MGSSGPQAADACLWTNGQLRGRPRRRAISIERMRTHGGVSDHEGRWSSQRRPRAKRELEG
jgi:hypothetical protein